MPFLTISGAVREIEARFGLRCSRRLLTSWFYNDVLDAGRCPVVDGRRQIPVDYLPAIAAQISKRRRATST